MFEKGEDTERAIKTQMSKRNRRNNYTELKRKKTGMFLNTDKIESNPSTERVEKIHTPAIVYAFSENKKWIKTGFIGSLNRHNR